MRTRARPKRPPRLPGDMFSDSPLLSAIDERFQAEGGPRCPSCECKLPEAGDCGPVTVRCACGRRCWVGADDAQAGG
jgi:hypothetical protein